MNNITKEDILMAYILATSNMANIQTLIDEVPKFPEILNDISDCSEQERPFACQQCDKKYKTKRDLKEHSFTHCIKRPFPCTFCPKSFISSSKLKQHLNIHTGARPYKCKYCPKDFTNFPNWHKHTRRFHKVDHRTGEPLDIFPGYYRVKKSMETAETVTATSMTTADNLPTNKPFVSSFSIASILNLKEEEENTSSSYENNFGKRKRKQDTPKQYKKIKQDLDLNETESWIKQEIQN